MKHLTPWPPHLTVASVLEKDGRFLVVEEKTRNGIVYNQPAGHLEPNETLIEATVRETQEETGWTYKPTGILGLYLYQGAQNNVTYQRICFTGTCLHHDNTQPLDEGIIQAHWLTRDELFQAADKLRSPMVLRCIDDYLAGHRYPLSLITDLRV